MIKFDYKFGTYTCPFCNKEQALNSYSVTEQRTGLYNAYPNRFEYAKCKSTELNIFSIKCSNKECEKISVLAMDYSRTNRVCDIIPRKVIRQFPDYIPSQIRADYEEATCILNDSPKAAATLYRRCLQGMIRDFYGISNGRLIDEIEELKGKIPAAQWNSIDALRKLGNIGAHMEKDVNLIIDIDEGEAETLQKLIELLLEKWYVARHDEEVLYKEITDISSEKTEERKGTK